MAECSAPADDKHLAALVSDNLQRRNVAGHQCHFPGPGVHHHLVILRIGGDDACGVLLQTADSVLQAGDAGTGPSADEGLGIPLKGCELAAALGSVVDERRMYLGKILHGRYPPGLGSVAEESLGEQDDRHHVLHGELTGVECLLEAVRRRMSGHHHDGALSVAAVKGLMQVGLLGLGRYTCGRAAALNIHAEAVR